MGILPEEALQAPQNAEIESQAREERLQLSLDAANVGTWEWNIRTGDVRWSPTLERIHGQEPGAFHGTFDGFLEGVHPDDRQPVLDAIRNAIVTGQRYEVEYRSTDADGATRWFEGRGRVSRDESGQAVWMSGLCMDTTERHRLQDRLLQRQRLESLGVLASGIAHDFNNLLTGILGNASLAEARLTPDDSARSLLGNVVTASRRAAELTQQLLAYAGKGRVTQEFLDLSEVVRELLPLVRPLIPPEVQLLLDLMPAPIIADSGQIHQVIMNLIINAAEAIDNAGTVAVTTGIAEVRGNAALESGMYAYLKVRDTGCGMDEKTIERIFDPFFSTKFAGRGLGLAAAHGIVSTHHGAIDVESAPDRGATFTVLFPAGDRNVAPVRQPLASVEPAGAGAILVVDDEEMVLEMAQTSLEIYGYSVLRASDGWAAVDVLTGAGDDVCAVVLDLTMPGMTCEETLKRLREIRPAMPVIIASGYGGTEITHRFQGAGIDGFLQKPYTPEQLAQCIAVATG